MAAKRIINYRLQIDLKTGYGRIAILLKGASKYIVFNSIRTDVFNGMASILSSESAYYNGRELFTGHEDVDELEIAEVVDMSSLS